MTTNGHVTERLEPARHPRRQPRTAPPAEAPPAADVQATAATEPASPASSARAEDFALPVRYLAVKYVASRVAAAVLLVALLPLLLVIAAALRWKLGPGVIYRQARIGQGGETFQILKFRTMEADRRTATTDRRSGDRAAATDRRQTHKSDHDPRHNALGRFLRKTSLDELPQLWNVVAGDMTLVGPRPELESVADKYGFRDHPRHVVVPGITGLWQVSEFRNELLHEHIDIDVDYVQKVSLGLDLRIIAQTLLLFVRPTGR